LSGGAGASRRTAPQWQEAVIMAEYGRTAARSE